MLSALYNAPWWQVILIGVAFILLSGATGVAAARVDKEQDQFGFGCLLFLLVLIFGLTGIVLILRGIFGN